MNTTELVHYVSTGDRPRPKSAHRAIPISYYELAAPLRRGILRARQFLFSAQRNDGAWLGQAAGDASLPSQLVLLLAYLGEADSELATQAANTILDQQLPSGGWSLIPGGPVDLSTSVQAYFALKLVAHDPSDERMAKARDVIRGLGGADAADASTRFFLALLGQISYDSCPVVAPELLIFDGPQRRNLAPLSILWSHRPVQEVGIARGVRELFVNRPSDWPAESCDKTPWPASRWRQVISTLLRRCEKHGWTPVRLRALNRVEAILLQSAEPGHLDQLSFHELVLTMLALETLGHGASSQPFDACQDRVSEMVVVEELADRAWPQLRTEPLADTALALRAMCSSGMSLRQIIGPSATRWLAQSHRSRHKPSTLEMTWLLDLLSTALVEPSELDASLPPDIQVGDDQFDSIATVGATALQRRARTVADRLVDQLIGQQEDDGGWAPHAGDESMSSPDVTGAVLKALATHRGERARHQAIDRGIAYLRASQCPDGSWSSATGVRLMHGTSLAACGLVAAGVSPKDQAVESGINWLVVHQQASGGWGELPAAASDRTTDDYIFGRASATQTAWALLALLAADLMLEEPARRAVQFLLETQEDDGRWHEPQFMHRDAATGRWYRNELHAVAWPLLALSRWAVAASAAESKHSDRHSLRLVGAADT
jgi:squalene-hopene/tetraprenyl-beta-curcumene cyclase